MQPGAPGGRPHEVVSAKRASGQDGPILFGIKTKLLLTFLALAALTVIACAIAWIVFSRIERAVTVITDRSIPEITLALSIAEFSSDIAASAPALATSATQEERSERRNRLDRAGAQLEELIARWQAIGIASDVAAELSAAAAGIADGLDVVDRAVERQLELESRLRQQARLLSATHGDFLETLEPLIDDAIFELVIDSERGNEQTGTALKSAVEAGADRLGLLATVKSDANLVVSLLREAAWHHAIDADEPVAVALAQASADFDDALGRLQRDGADADLRRDGEAILAFLGGETGVATADPAIGAGGLDTLSAVWVRFLDTIDPMMTEARDDLVATAGGIADRQARAMADLVDQGSFRLYHLLSLRAEGNLAVGLLGEAASLGDGTRLTTLQERFDAAAGQLERALKRITGPLNLRTLRILIGTQLGFGRGETDMFDLKQAQLAQKEVAARALETVNAQSVALRNAVAELVRIAESMSDATAGDAEATIENSKIFILLISLVSILCAILVMLAFVSPRVIRPIEDITGAMTRLADGDTSADIPGRDRRDELGRMAHALGVFRDITIEVQKSNLLEIETARRRLSDAIESISEAFSLYDADDRLVVCNQKYGTLVHPEIAEEIRPGLTFEHIIRRATEVGFIAEASGREEAWLAERLARHRNPGPPHIMQRTNGVWIMVSERKTAEGGIVAVYSDITELKERENELAEKSKALEQLSSQLSKYLSPQIYQSIFTGEQAAIVASKRKKLTVFFSDLEGFTEIADRLESEDLSQLLNEYLTEMSKIALAHGATIDKYVGDAIMIFFGDPISQGIGQDALNCVKMAIEMQRRLAELSAEWTGHGLTEPLKCRMGIATGFCTVGNFGSEDRMDYTIIGGAVNLAARLEGTAEAGTILISAETQNLVHEAIACRAYGTVKVKGLAYPVKTYVVVDREQDVEQPPARILEEHGRLSVDLDLAAMSDEDREKAARLLREVMDKLSIDDKPPDDNAPSVTPAEGKKQ